MQSHDVNAVFARAEQAFMADRLDEARAALAQVQRWAGDHPSVLHLLALVEKKSGAVEAAEKAFKRALALAPRDPQILNNYANLLVSAGEPESALAVLDRALQAAPSFGDARYNRALVLQELGQLDKSLADLDRLAAHAPASAKLYSARGNVLRLLDRVDDAALDYDLALRLDPARPVALHGRARVAMERGEENAADHYRRALAAQPDNLELQLGLALALEADGEDLALPLLATVVGRFPEWIEGHEQLARMRSEAGETEDLGRSFEEALAVLPRHRALHHAHWQTLAQAGRFGDALAAIDKAREYLPEDPDALLMEASFRSENGERDSADALLAGLDDAIDVQMVRGRHALRKGDPLAAAGFLDAVVERTPDDMAAWAHLSLAWRLLEDPRHQWLCLQPGLWRVAELDLSAAQLEETAHILRGLHTTRAHPIGQSLRGGTQTRGRLLLRSEPALVRLREMLMLAIKSYVDGLPAVDSRHPLLRHKGSGFQLAGSWSVRLSHSGFHVNHVHPRGVISSACYIALPDSLGADDTRDGWLELGAPPSELGLDLAPLASVGPVPGRLALFPAFLFHGTRPFRSGERLTVAFDAVPQ